MVAVPTDICVNPACVPLRTRLVGEVDEEGTTVKWCVLERLSDLRAKPVLELEEVGRGL